MVDFMCSTRREDGLAVVTASGDVDLAAVNQLWDKLSAELLPRAVVVLDCAGITFLDSMGIRVLVRARNQAKKERATFELVRVSAPVARVLKLAGLTRAFPAFADLEAAKAEAAPPSFAGGNVSQR